MAIRWNLLFALTNAAWAAILTLGVVPIYIRYLGVGAYGLIGFFSTTQALFQVLDFGVAPTVNREIARAHTSDEISEARSLLNSLQVVTWVVACCIGVTMILLGSGARSWFKASNIPEAELGHAVTLMGIAIAARWPVALYQGALSGAQRQNIVSIINIGMITLANGGAILIIGLHPNVSAFFMWQACVGIVYALSICAICWRVIGRPKSLWPDFGKVTRVWTFSLGMMTLTIAGLLFAQLDKVLLSHLIPLNQFGNYVLSALLASGLYVLITPFYNVIYPRFSALVAKSNTQAIWHMYELVSQLLATSLFSLAAVIAVFSEEIIRLWTGNASLAASAGPVASILVVGTAIHGVMYIPYAAQLAYGNLRIPLITNLVLLALMVPALFIFVSKFGVVGAAFAWLLLHTLYFILGTWLMHRSIFRGLGRRWIFIDIGLPFAGSVVAGGFCLSIKHLAIFSSAEKIFLGIMATGLCALMVVLLSRHLRDLAAAFLARFLSIAKGSIAK